MVDETKLLKCCKDYIRNTAISCDLGCTCYASEMKRGDLHQEMVDMLEVEYDDLTGILCNLEKAIGFPSNKLIEQGGKGGDFDRRAKERESIVEEYGEKLFKHLKEKMAKGGTD